MPQEGANKVLAEPGMETYHQRPGVSEKLPMNKIGNTTEAQNPKYWEKRTSLSPKASLFKKTSHILGLGPWSQLWGERAGSTPIGLGRAWPLI